VKQNVNELEMRGEKNVKDFHDFGCEILKQIEEEDDQKLSENWEVQKLKEIQ
jgi:hypothetical protein